MKMQGLHQMQGLGLVCRTIHRLVQENQINHLQALELVHRTNQLRVLGLELQINHRLERVLGHQIVLHLQELVQVLQIIHLLQELEQEHQTIRRLLELGHRRVHQKVQVLEHQTNPLLLEPELGRQTNLPLLEPELEHQINLQKQLELERQMLMELEQV